MQVHDLAKTGGDNTVEASSTRRLTRRASAKEVLQSVRQMQHKPGVDHFSRFLQAEERGNAKRRNSAETKRGSEETKRGSAEPKKKPTGPAATIRSVQGRKSKPPAGAGKVRGKKGPGRTQREIVPQSPLVPWVTI
jgi:hypothetical protein